MTPYNLYIYYDDTEGNRLPFPDAKEPAVLRKWKYSVERQQNSVPTVEATLMYPRCLEDEWNALRPYILLENGERLDADRIFPDSQKTNDDARFSHTIYFVSQRARLKNILFFDAVTTQAQNDRYASNSTDFVFSGTLREFVDRLEASLAFNGISDFSFVIDEGVDDTKTAEVSFSDAYMTEAVGHILSDFNINYYWVGNVCHIGDFQNDIETPLEYGRGKGLLVVKKSNTDERPVNAVTGFGGSTNIPFYYPNEEEYGKTHYNVKNAVASDIVIDWSKVYSNTGTGITDIILAKKTASTRELFLNSDFFGSNVCTEWHNYDAEDGSGMVSEGYLTTCVVTLERSINITGQVGAYLDFRSALYFKPDAFCRTKDGRILEAPSTFNSKQLYVTRGGNITNLSLSGQAISVNLDYPGLTTVTFELSYNVRFFYNNLADTPDSFFLKYSSPSPARLYSGSDSDRQWLIGGKFYYYSLLGISLPDSYTNYADFHTDIVDNGLQGAERIFSFSVTEQNNTKAKAVTINVTGRDYIPPTGKLVPSIFRETNGEERFYYANNHADDDSCTDKTSAQHTAFATDDGFLSFENVFSVESAVQAAQTFEDIVPTIKNVTNRAGQKIAEIVDVAFDDDDNDNVDADGKYLHPYFYIRLRVFDGSMGFSLFDHALQGEEAKIYMTSCNGCPTCQFTIQALYDADGKAYNPVLVDSNGDILKGDYTNRLSNSWKTCSESNQDTSLHSVWIAVAKEETTLGTIMPSAAANLRPVAGDTFVITGISFPLTYIRAAEKALDKALVDYMSERNSGTFEYDVTLSRIFLQDNPDIAGLINENSRLWLSYNGKSVQLYISAFSVSVDDDILANIAISLSSEFKAYESRIDKAISSAVASSKSDILSQQKSKERTTPILTRGSVPEQEETPTGNFLTMETASENFLPIPTFSDLFEKVIVKEAVDEVRDADGNIVTEAQPAEYAIKAKYDLFSVGGISAYGFSGTGSGGGTASVDVTAILKEGVHIATINGVEIFAPSVDVTPIETSGTPIATINGVNIFAPKGGASSWDELTGNPPGVLTFPNDAGYLTSAALSGYATTEYVAQNYVKLNDFNIYKTKVSKAISDSAQGVKDWVTEKRYGKSLGTNGNYIRLLDESDRELSKVIAPYAAYTEQLGKPFGDHNGLRTQYWTKNDNYGYPTYLLISEVCNASEWASWGTGHPLFGISGTVSGARTGNMYGTGTWHVNACVSYSTDYILTETSNSQWMQPCVVTYNGKVYVALRLLGSGYDIIFVGNYTNLLDNPIQVNCTDASGTCSAISVLRDYTGVRLTAKDLDVTGSLVVAGNVNTNFDISAGGSLSVTGESRFSGAVYLPGQLTFFGQSGIYIEADRTTQREGTAAFIGVHRSFNGDGTIAHVNLDGRVKIAQPMGIRQDPETDISLRVGGVLKTDYLTAGNMARPEGYWFASPNGYFGNPSTKIYTSFGDGGLKLSQATPYIDFHYGCSTPDYTSRLITSENGVLWLQSATADPALRIGNAYLRYDKVNNALYVTGQNGAQVHLYATGGIAAYSGLGSGITQLANLSLTGQLTAASVKANRYTIGEENFLYENSSGQLEFSLYDSLGFGGSSTYFNSDGWLYMNSANEIQLTGDAALRIGANTDNHRITDLYADGSYVYITVNGKRYRLTPSSTTTV